MSTRPQLSPSFVITNGNMSTSINSLPTVIPKISMVSYGLNWTGTSPVGTASVQASNDFSLNPNGTVNNPGTWSTITFFYNGSVVISIPISGNTGNVFINIDQIASYALRLVYTASSGVGTLNAVVNGKVS